MTVLLISFIKFDATTISDYYVFELIDELFDLQSTLMEKLKLKTFLIRVMLENLLQ